MWSTWSAHGVLQRANTHLCLYLVWHGWCRIEPGITSSIQHNIESLLPHYTCGCGLYASRFVYIPYTNLSTNHLGILNIHQFSDLRVIVQQFLQCLTRLCVHRSYSCMWHILVVLILCLFVDGIG